LRNTLERAVLLGNRTTVRPEDLAIRTPGTAEFQRPGSPLGTLVDNERAHIAAVLQAQGGDVKKAAPVLGLSRSALYEKLKKHGLTASR
jgi:DNA-binding NtrC family response regulator